MKITLMPGRIVVCALLAAGVLWSAAESGLSAPVLNSLSAQPGAVDLSFDFTNGTYSVIKAITADPDGKLLIGGHAYLDWSATRLNPDGTADASFQAGSVYGDVNSIVILENGKILIGGALYNNRKSYCAGVARLNSDGTLDLSFGLGGSLGGYVISMAVQPDGKILIAGSFDNVKGVFRSSVARLNIDGLVDKSFSPACSTNDSRSDRVQQIRLQNDGKIVVSTTFSSLNGLPFGYIARLNSDGTLDGNFDTGTGADGQVFPIALANDGGVFITGCFQNFNGIPNKGLMRLYGGESAPSAPAFRIQPIEQVLSDGKSVAFSALASALPQPTYQWQLNGQIIAGATHPLLMLTNLSVSDAGTYQVLASNSLGSVLSEPRVLSAPTILLQPLSQTGAEDHGVSFSIVVTNLFPVSLQWQFEGTNILGATTPTLVLKGLQMAQGGRYSAIASDLFGSVTSAIALLVVKPVSVGGPGVVLYADQLGLQVALNDHVPVTFGVNGTITLTDTLLITTNTTLDATGRTISLDGNNAVRHFVVTNGATLRLINLNLINGKFAGPIGDTNKTGNPGWGGSIYNAGGTLELIGCSFLNNQAFGGDGGPVVEMFPDVATGGPTAGAPAYGGAIYSVDGAVWATNCSFANNRVQGGQGKSGDSLNGQYTGAGGDCYGGAIFTSSGAVSLANVSFSNNLAQAGEMSGGRPLNGGGRSYGGALADAFGTTLVTNCVFVGNQALGAVNVFGAGSDQGSANAGALFHDGGTMSVSQTLFSSNSVTGGGGTGRNIIITSASGIGGAVINRAGNLELKSCALLFNKASGGAANDFGGQSGGGVSGMGLGGAIYNMAFLTLANCTAAENGAVVGLPGPFGGVVTAPGGGALGGFLFNSGGSASLLNVTVADNYATAGASSSLATGASIDNTSGSVTLTNTILLCASSQTNVSGTIIDGGHNLSSDASAKFTLPTSRNNTDPLLGPLADNGGPTPTRALLLGSPALDAGENAVCPTTDQRGIPRPMGSGCDIGAFELAPKLSLTRGPQGNVRIDFIFEPSKTYAVKASTNLVDWLTLGTGTSDTNGWFEFKDTSGTQFPRRFYRVE